MDQENNVTRRLIIGLAVGAIFGLGIGLTIGLAFGYIISPPQWTDGGPQDLREDYAAYYWELAAESYAKHGDLELAKRQLGEWENPDRLQAALTRARIESSPELQMVLDSLEKKVVDTTGAATTTPSADQTPTAQPEGEKKGLSLPSLLGVFLLIVLALAVIGVLVARMRKRREEQPAAVQEEAPPEWLATMRPEESAPTAPPLGHFVTSYALGNDSYDESFSIETSSGDFLGECGVGISETIGVGKPDKVTAFEVWLFDKNDIRTITQVLMSEHALNDPELRATLAPKGEAILTQVNEPLVLETATLRLDVVVTERVYGAGALPSNSYFDRLTVELVASQKEGKTGSPDSATV